MLAMEALSVETRRMKEVGRHTSGRMKAKTVPPTAVRQMKTSQYFHPVNDVSYQQAIVEATHDQICLPMVASAMDVTCRYTRSVSAMTAMEKQMPLARMWLGKTSEYHTTPHTSTPRLYTASRT